MTRKRSAADCGGSTSGCSDCAISPRGPGTSFWATGQRNILVHLYLEVDPARIYETLQRDLDAFDEFAAIALRLVEP